MNRITIILLLFFFLFINLSAQNNDCINAVPVCSDDAISFDPRGVGVQELTLSNSGCLESNETNSAWYFFRVNDNTPPNTVLNFEIEPECRNDGEDYDFAVFGPDIECDNLNTPIRCSYAAPVLNCSITGLRDSDIDFSEGSGGNGFVNSLRVNAGETYYLLVDNFEGSGTGFTLNWSGLGATFLDCAIVCELTVETQNYSRCKGAGAINLDLEVMSTVDQFTFLWDSPDPSHVAFLNQTNIKDPIADIPDDFIGQIIYNVKVESLDSSCFETKEVIIDIKEDLEIIVNDTIVCQNIGQLDLAINVNNGIGELSSEWRNDQGRLDWLTDFSLSPSILIPADFIGTTTFTIEVTDETGSCTATEMIMIDVREQLQIAPLSEIDIPCEEGDIDIGGDLNIDPDLDIAWFFNNQVFSNDRVINVNTPGEYVLEVSNGICTYMDTVLVAKDNGIREASFQNLSMICSDTDLGSIDVSVEEGGLMPFEFFINGVSFGTNPIIDNVPLGTNQLVIVDGNNCRFTFSILFEVPFPLNTTLDIGVDREVELGLNTQATLTTNLIDSQIRNIEWFFNNQPLMCNNCNEIDFMPTQNGYLQVELTNENGCAFRDSLFVTTFELGKDLFAPNAFSPNGDNINDRFTIFGGEGVAAIESLQVYDRWGNQVYSASNLPINDASQGWDGRYKGKPLNAGVFIYYARLLLTNQKFKEIKGDVAIIK